MNHFEGFPPRMEFTSIPNLFFSKLLPEINDMAELKTILYALAVLYRKRGYPRFITFGELLENVSLMNSLKGGAEPPDKALNDALKMATERGIFIHMSLDRDGANENIYLLNTEANLQIAAKIQSGELKLSGLKPGAPSYVTTEEQPNVFALYEQNIGLLTPMIAEELREAEKLYPESWLRDAIKEATLHNKRNIRYIMKILQRWSAEGKSDGTHPRHSKTDPDKYIKGKYGHIVRR